MRILTAAAVISVLGLMAQEPQTPASPAPAQTGELPPGVYRVGGGVSPPHLIKKVEPQYSKEARLAHLEGIVRLQAVVTAKGSAQDFKVLRSLGLGLDESAIRAVSDWVFSPGALNGEAVDVLANFEINFRWLPQESKDWWRLRRVDFQIPAAASRPILEKVAAPEISDAPGTPNIHLTFDIDEKGEPVHVPVYEGSNEGFSREVAAALSKWRFIPASKDGHPISVSCTMEFVRGN